MIPSYGFCNIPPCEKFAENVCDEFFSLPLFPQQTATLGGAANSCGTAGCTCMGCGMHCGMNCSMCPRCGRMV